ncbi:hypothetical protein RI129_002424 [Pyrocoelia pectoralis]|uniref:Uncharacterized protein n=1 Tax=Pyrocoelia pectoralis TaxID=417401 RepID=A0AAN7VGJ0_9COLE
MSAVSVKGVLKVNSNNVDFVKEAPQTARKCIDVDDSDAETFIDYIENKFILPEDNEKFILFFDCVVANQNLFDVEGDVNQDLLRTSYATYLSYRFDVSVEKIESILEGYFLTCYTSPRITPRALNAIKRRNCGMMYIAKTLNKIVK